MEWFYGLLILAICFLALMILSSKPKVRVNYSTHPMLLPKDNGVMTPSMRLHHIWMRSLAINDEKMCIFEEACGIYGVDPDSDSKERDAVEELFLHMNMGVTPALVQIRIDEVREARRLKSK